jgi:hypothetical protein
MSIPDERLPDLDGSYEEESNSSESSGLVDSLAEEDELEFESAEADTADDDDEIEIAEPSESDTAGFGYGEPVE